MAEFARLALGTVQFGLPYGLRQPADRVADAEVAAILARAWERGIDLLDTAAAYGEAERVVGANRPPQARFQLVSKTLPLNLPRIGPAEVSSVVDGVRRSLRLLHAERLHGMLAHAATDLLAPGGRLLLDALLRLKGEGVIDRVGVSVYDPEILRRLLELPLDMVQIPCNVFDQRFAEAGLIEAMAARGIEVHARSAFLQGLLLKEPRTIPPHLVVARERVAVFQIAAAARGLSPAAAALAHVARLKGVARIVVGVDSLAMFDANLDAYTAAVECGAAMDFSEFSTATPSIIDPRRWAA